MCAMTAEHFATTAERNIHIIRDDVDFGDAERTVREAASSLHYFLAEIDGRTIVDEPSAICAMSKALRFPVLGGPDAELNWNSVADYVGDLGWIAPAANRPGIVLFLKYPDVLASRDTVSFAILLDTISLSARPSAIMRPFHFVLGPLSYRYEILGNMMVASKHFCIECQMADGCEGAQADSPPLTRT